MKYLIIGGAGFIGYHLAQSLSKNLKNKIVIIDNFQRTNKDREFKNLSKKKNIRFIKKDFENIIISQIDKDFDYIFHLASIVGVKNVVSEPSKVLKQNIDLIYKLIDISKLQKKLKKVCFTSTSEIYANSVKFNISKTPSSEKDLITVSSETISRDSYFLSKLICEKILTLCKIPFLILRLHNIYGPRMGYSHVIPEMFIKIKKNKNYITVFSHNHTRAFCYISDAIDQILSLTLKKITKNKVINVGNSQEEIKIIDLVKKILRVLKLKRKLIIKKDIKGSPKRRCPNMKLNYFFTKKKPSVSLELGIAKTYNWYKH